MRLQTIHLRGAAFMVAASLGFALMGVFVKAVSVTVPTSEVVLWRTAVTAAFVLGYALQQGVDLRPVNTRIHLLRGCIGMASMLCYFFAIARLPLGDAVLITYTSPLIVALLAPYTVGERASPRVWGALAIGILGVGLVVGPAFSRDPLGVAAAGAAAWFAAGAYLSVKVLTRTDHPVAIVWWFSVIGTVLASVAVVDGVSIPSWSVAGGLLAIGIIGAFAQGALTQAYGAAPAAVVSVFAYATPLFAYALARVAFGEVPGIGALLGTALVVVAGAVAAGDEVKPDPPSDGEPV